MLGTCYLFYGCAARNDYLETQTNLSAGSPSQSRSKGAIVIAGPLSGMYCILLLHAKLDLSTNAAMSTSAEEAQVHAFLVLIVQKLCSCLKVAFDPFPALSARVLWLEAR